VAELNGRLQGEPLPQELFEELERSALKPLPAQRYELAEWKKVTVNIDYHVEYDTNIIPSLTRLCTKSSSCGHESHGRGLQSRPAGGEPRREYGRRR